MIRAFAANKPGDELSSYEYDPGELAADYVEIDVEFCGICHSDLSMLNNEWGITQYPFVPGHEVIGTISQMGESAQLKSRSKNGALKIGQRVGLGWHSDYCHQCQSCYSGDHNLCKSAQGTIIKRHGGFADKVRAHYSSVVALPENIDAESAGPLFCGGITVFNPLDQFSVPSTARVAVIGIGGLGHLALQILNAWGCEVTAFTSSESKREEALSLGAHKTLMSNDSDQIKKAAGQFDLILSTVNVDLDWQAYLSTLRPKGRLHFVGAVATPIKLSVFSLMSSQISVSSSPVGSPATMAKMLEFCARHGIKAQVECFAFDQVNEALKKVEDGSVRYRAVLSHSLSQS